MSCDKAYHVIGDKWNCSMVKDAIAVYCKEVFHLLADVVDTEDPSTRSIFPRPGKEERFVVYSCSPASDLAAHLLCSALPCSALHGLAHSLSPQPISLTGDRDSLKTRLPSYAMPASQPAIPELVCTPGLHDIIYYVY